MIELPGHQIAYYSQKAFADKPMNEDALLITNFSDVMVLAVADGVGGSQQGAQAAKKVLEVIRTAKPEGNSLSACMHAVIDAIEKANQALVSDSAYALTTLTLCLIKANNMRTIQVGDSGLLLCGQRGKLHYSVSTHSPIGQAVESGFLDEAEALQHPDLNVVNNVVGDASMHIEIGPAVKIKKHDTLLLASDGLFDNFLVDDVMSLVKHGSLVKVADRLTQSCQQQQHPITQKAYNKDDDISFILCRRR